MGNEFQEINMEIEREEGVLMFCPTQVNGVKAKAKNGSLVFKAQHFCSLPFQLTGGRLE